MQTKKNHKLGPLVPRLLEVEFVQRVLDIYEKKYQFVTQAAINENGIRAIINVNEYPYTKTTIFDYVTAPSLSLVIGQACYLYMGDLIRNRSLSQIEDIDLEKYIELRDKGDLVFTNMNYKFSKKINHSIDFSLEISLRAIKRMKTFVIARFEFSVPGHLHGEMSLIANLG